jgi:hypothetical protein
MRCSGIVLLDGFIACWLAYYRHESYRKAQVLLSPPLWWSCSFACQSIKASVKTNGQFDCIGHSFAAMAIVTHWTKGGHMYL